MVRPVRFGLERARQVKARNFFRLGEAQYIMVRRYVGLLSSALLMGTGLWAQGLDTQASKDDWEEINFDFNSSVLVDGFPSLLRLSELLQANAGYHVRVEGHTDGIGSDSFNQRLGLARANTVRDFLVK